ncbi:MAG: DUF3298 domain-containing protein, partial [bacterium]|nr:DUF3298 domain-containing protein [bacterium]
QSIPKLLIETEYLMDWQEGQQTFNGTASQIYLLDDTYSKLQTAFAELNQKAYDNLKTIYDENLEFAREWVKDSGTHLEEEFELIPMRNDADIVSLQGSEYTYLGGAHPSTYVSGYNWNPQTGEEYALQDVTEEYDALYALLLEELERYYDSESFFEGYQDTVKEMFYAKNREEGQLQWMMNSQELMLYFNSYEIAPYASGPVTVTISFAEHPEFIKEKFLKAAKDDVLYLGSNGTVNWDLNGDGSKDSITFSSMEDDMNYQLITLQVNDKELSKKLDGYSAKAYLLCGQNGSNYLYVELGTDNDYRYLEVFDLNGEEPSLIGETELGSFYDLYPTSSRDFLLASHMDVLGTYYVYRSFTLGEDGMPQLVDGVYRLYGYQTGKYDHVLTAKRDIPAWKENADGSEERTVLPAGSHFHLRETDGESYVKGILDDGESYRISIEKSSEWGHNIEGVFEEECFDGIMYAG